MEHEDRLIVRELIEAVISADGVVSEAEREYLKGISRRLGLDLREGGPPSDVGQATAKLRALPPDNHYGERCGNQTKRDLCPHR